MRNGLFGLRHHAVVGCHNEHDDVGNLRAARAHSRERFVARRVDEHHPALAYMRFIRADVLRDSARFAGGHFGFADCVEQAGLAVVYVTHHGDHGSARLHVPGALFFDLLFLNELLLERDHLHDPIESFREVRGRRNVQRLVDAGENSAVEQHFQQFLGADIELFGELADRDAFRDRDFARLALHRGDRLGLHGASARARTRARAHRMKLALAFGESLLYKRASAACGRLARI